MMTVEGGTTAAVFIEFLEEHLVPRLRPGDIVVMDNWVHTTHYATGVRERIEACGAEVLYQSPYSPGLNPIEPAWSKIKTTLRSFGARTISLLRKAVLLAAYLVTAEDAVGWFKHCGVLAAQPS